MKLLNIIGIIMGITAMAFAWIGYGWELSLIIFLAIFGNNLERSTRK